MRFLKINANPGRAASVLLAVAPFALVIAVYLVTAHQRHKENPQDKLVPTLSEMGRGFYSTAFEPDRKDEYRLLVDTLASGRRFLISVALMSIAVLIGLHMGLLPYVEKLLLRFVVFFDKIPALAVLPILFIVFGLGETSKVMLIVIGTALVMIRAVAQGVSELPEEMIVKAQTLGASTWQLIIRVIVPQILPKLFMAIRLGLVPAWIFLVSAEAIASTEGLGYRIFLVRRYLAMDVILPYVAWITLIAYILDRILMLVSRWLFPWSDNRGGAV